MACGHHLVRVKVRVRARVRVKVRVRVSLYGPKAERPLLWCAATPTPTHTHTPNPNQGFDELSAGHGVDVTQHTLVERQLELLVDEHHVAHRVELLRQLHLVRGRGRGRGRVRGIELSFCASFT